MSLQGHSQVGAGLNVGQSQCATEVEHDALRIWHLCVGLGDGLDLRERAKRLHLVNRHLHPLAVHGHLEQNAALRDGDERPESEPA